jgi:hypothetical protein
MMGMGGMGGGMGGMDGGMAPPMQMGGAMAPIGPSTAGGHDHNRPPSSVKVFVGQIGRYLRPASLSFNRFAYF